MSEMFDARMLEWREQIDSMLSTVLRESAYPDEFKEILEYAVFPGGKRLRPILFLEWHGLYAPPSENGLKFACGIELMHCYSLIHDDMPCMDNDDIRRGKPTVHKKYGEGKALLAGDALLDLSYNCMFEACLAAKVAKPSLFYMLSGDRGIIHGQFFDLYKHCDTLDELIDVYRKKTGALIKAACLDGYLFMQNVNPVDFKAAVSGELQNRNNMYDPLNVMRISSVNSFGENFGIAFQLYDDVSEYIAGEPADGQSVLDFVDLDKAKELLNSYLNAAEEELVKTYNGDTSYLRELVEKYVIL